MAWLIRGLWPLGVSTVDFGRATTEAIRDSGPRLVGRDVNQHDHPFARGRRVTYQEANPDRAGFSTK